MTIIELRPHRGGWQCWEAPGVQPFFTGPDAKGYAVRYAQGRTAQRYGEIRVLRVDGSVGERRGQLQNYAAAWSKFMRLERDCEADPHSLLYVS